jgi:hypothetical protein
MPEEINMVVHSSKQFNEQQGDLKRQIRLIYLLDAAENAGIAPITVLRLHTFAYLSNVLSPVWDIPALEGKILKRYGGPFYPIMQQELDRLVGLGVVRIINIKHVQDEHAGWRLEGSYSLNREFADNILKQSRQIESERRLMQYIQELAYAISALNDDDLTNASVADAAYSDPLIDVGNVVDFEEWKFVNYSANVAQHFKKFLPSGSFATKGEMLHFYIHHLSRRLHGGR